MDARTACRDAAAGTIFDRMEMRIRPAEELDGAEWLRMRNAMWPSDDHAVEIDRYFRRSGDAELPALVLVAEREAGALAGFLELGLRPYAEGCASSPVPFIEGWFVDEDVRRAGVGTQLVRAAERWAKSQGYREMASDVELDNEVSIAAHGRLGYEEVTRLVCFRRDL
jgi:aminoglycoside 6'-N-acetyltransferase I